MQTYIYIYIYSELQGAIFERITTAKIIPDDTKPDFYCHTA